MGSHRKVVWGGAGGGSWQRGAPNGHFLPQSRFLVEWPNVITSHLCCQVLLTCEISAPSLYLVHHFADICYSACETHYCVSITGWAIACIAFSWSGAGIRNAGGAVFRVCTLRNLYLLTIV